MEISAADVKALREKSGAGIMDCKEALKESGGDQDKAIKHLRERGLAAARNKANRSTGDGLICSYIHPGAKVGVLLELNCETDFVAKTDGFQTLTRDIAMHIAAMSPIYVRREDVPEELVEKEKEIYAAQAREAGKPEKILEKIAEGRIEKFFKEICLLEQPFAKKTEISVGDLIAETVAKVGENIQLKRYARFKLGENGTS